MSNSFGIYRSIGISMVLIAVIGCGTKDNVIQPTIDSHAESRAEIRNTVAGIETEVEQFRGEVFTRAITPIVYSRSEYTELVNQGQFSSSSLTASQKDLYNRIFVRQGFLRSGNDYFEESDAVYSTSVAGFYRDGTDSIWIIMPDLSWDMDLNDSITVFHELLHALQDQRFGLGALKSGVSSSDEAYAFRYMVEGEAKFLDEFYYARGLFGYYPSANTVDDVFNTYADNANSFIADEMAGGTPCFVIQPFFWGYYSYGPLFISANTSGTDWAGIDDIFNDLPVKTREVMHPELYQGYDRSGYTVDLSGLLTLLDQDYTLFDRDCLGEMLTCTMLREWGIASYLSAAAGLRTDCELMAGDSRGDNLAFYWLTVWDSAADAEEFALAYRSLLEAKYGITMPVFSGNAAVYDGAVPLLVKYDGTRVYVMENYPATRRDAFLAEMEDAVITDWGSVSAKAAVMQDVPFIEKDRLGRIYPQLPEVFR